MSDPLHPGDDIMVHATGWTRPGRVLRITQNQVAALIALTGASSDAPADVMAVIRHDMVRGIYRCIIDSTDITMRRHHGAAQRGEGTNESAT